MGIAFVDIDGVLFPHGAKEWSRVAINNLNRLCEDYELEIVITSEWRKKHSISQLQEIFSEKGVTAPIVGCTGLLMEDGMSTDAQKRTTQIHEYLNENLCHRFVILDDMHLKCENFVQCRSWIGFTKLECDEAEKFLLANEDQFDNNYEIRSGILHHLYHHPLSTFGDINYGEKLELCSTREVSSAMYLLLKSGTIEKISTGYTDDPMFVREVYKITDKHMLSVMANVDYGI